MKVALSELHRMSAFDFMARGRWNKLEKALDTTFAHCKHSCDLFTEKRGKVERDRQLHCLNVVP